MPEPVFENDEARGEMYRALFNSEVGRLVLRDLYQACKLDEDVFHPENERMTAHNLGRRSVAVRIKKLMEKTNA